MGSVQTEESLLTAQPSLRPACRGNSFLRDSISKGGFFGSRLESAFSSFRERREFVLRLISLKCLLLEVRTQQSLDQVSKSHRAALIGEGEQPAEGKSMKTEKRAWSGSSVDGVFAARLNPWAPAPDHINLAWRCTPVIPLLKRWSEEVLKLRAVHP